MFRSAVVALLLLVAPALAIEAQFPTAQPGTRVRVRTPDGAMGRVQGTVIANDGHALVIAPDHGEPIRIAAERITSLELSLGRSALAGLQSGALWGMSVSLPAALLISNAGGAPSDPFVAAASGGLVVFGALAGAVIGANMGKERWQRVDGSVHPVVARSADGVRLGMRMEW